MERIKIGRVGVNSGTLMVIDPCHIKKYFGPNEYNQALNVRISPEMGGQVCTPDGKDWLAVSFQSGFGDGLYDVYAIIERLRFGGSFKEKRITKIEIELIGPEMQRCED